MKIKLQPGDTVEGASCLGAKFTGKVIRMHSKTTVLLTPNHITPLGLITRFNGRKIKS